MRPRREDYRPPGSSGSREYPPAPSGYYYSSSGASRSSAPSPGHHPPPLQHRPPNGFHHPPPPQQAFMAPPPPSTPRSRGVEESTPSYSVEHLATFAVGRQYGLVNPSDGVRKLKDMEKKSAIWAQPMVLRLRPNQVAVEDDNGELVEAFPMELIEKPTAHTSNDPREQYNNMLLFVVNEDARGGARRGSSPQATPTEMHIFQCNRVAATEVAEDLQKYIRGAFREVRPGRRSNAAFASNGYHQYSQHAFPYPPAGDDASISSESSEMFERDVNTLNRCFDDIERFVARIQAAAIAQREIEVQSRRYRTANRRDKRAAPPPTDPHGILYMRSRVPNETEFVDILRKFKLSFNLLAKLKNHIHEPNAPELLHFLFTPLTVILDACHWGLGRNVAPQVVSPLLMLETRELMQNCLSSKETDIWMSLGDAWRTPPEDWTGPLPAPYRPVFIDGFAPYGLPDSAPAPGPAPPGAGHHSSSSLHHTLQHQPAPLHRGESAPPGHYRGRDEVSSQRGGARERDRSYDISGLDLDRISLERERVEFEKMMLEKEKRLLEEEKALRAEKARLDAERRLMHEEQERKSVNSGHYIPGGGGHTNYSNNTSMVPSPAGATRPNGHSTLDTVDGIGSGPGAASNLGSSPREQTFINDMISRRCKIVQATYDRTSMNAKELSVHRGEYLEVLNDQKNWWECKNMHNRVGYVPHTILVVTPHEALVNGGDNDIYSHTPHQQSNGGVVGVSGGSSPAYRPAPSPRPGGSSSFHVTSDAGIQTNIHQRYAAGAAAASQPNPPAPAPATRIPEPPPPPSLFQQQLSSAQDRLKKLSQQKERSDEENERFRKPVLIINRRPEEEAVAMQMRETLTKTEGRHLQPRKTPLTVQLSEISTSREVATWLEEKGFSPRTIELLSDQDGANLFSLSRPKLMEVCGREEGSRLYSQMLVQKRRSGYQTRTGAELKAILNFRKTSVDVRNEAPSEEPMSLPQENGIASGK